MDPLISLEPELFSRQGKSFTAVSVSPLSGLMTTATVQKQACWTGHLSEVEVTILIAGDINQTDLYQIKIKQIYIRRYEQRCIFTFLDVVADLVC